MKRSAAGVALFALVTGHLAFDAYFRTFAPIPREATSFVENGVLGAWLGVVFGQPVLIAIVAVFWPARTAARVLAALVLLAMMSYANVIGEYRLYARPIGNQSVVMGLGLFLGSLVPLTIARRARGWRIERPSTVDRKGRADQFNLQSIFVLVTAACVLLAAGRLVMPLVQLSLGRLIESLIFVQPLLALVAAGCTLPLLPAVGTVLSSRRPDEILRRSLPIATAVVVATSAIFGLTLGAEGVVMVLAILASGYGSIILSLYVLRWCGFRLVRGQEQEGGSDSDAGALASGVAI
jgi:hypothetical protein